MDNAHNAAKEAADRLEQVKIAIDKVLSTLPPMAHSVLFTHKTEEEQDEVRQVIHAYAAARVKAALAANPELSAMDRTIYEVVMEEVFIDGILFVTGWFQQKELARINNLMKELN